MQLLAVISAVLSLGSSAFADSGSDSLVSVKLSAVDGNSLLGKIQHRLQTAQAAIDCTGSSSQLCPLTVVPKANFSSTGGAVSSSAGACCPGTFTQCQVQQNLQYCRDLMYYTINPGQGNSEEVCPPTTPACTCQKQFSAEKDMRMYLCPTPSNCCKNCECHGDPHCSSFDKGSKVWAICDDRDQTCVHSQTLCAQTKYGDVQCVWSNSGGAFKNPSCVLPTGTPAPQMNMYKKTYKNYWNAADNTVYTFSLDLQLGVYGAINEVDITDAGTTYSFKFVNGKCVTDPHYPFDGNNQVHINNLPSGVSIVLYCSQGYGNSATGNRWDVLQVQDPWYVTPHPSEETFAGFCATGLIPESTGKTPIGGCSVVDNQIATYLANSGQCKGNLVACKKQWCAKNVGILQFGSTPQSQAQTQAACISWLTGANSANFFVQAVCSVSPAVANGVFPVDPSQCLNQDDCKQCVDNIMDYPDGIAQILGTTNTATLAPTIPCPGDLLTIGLNRKQLPTVGDGIQIDYQAPGTTTWTPVFALFDQEIESCGGCYDPILVNGTIAANLPLLTPGTYRMKQCHGLDTDPTQDLCTAVPQYNVSVTYTFPFSGVAVSTPFGTLFDQGDLACSHTKFPDCPPDFTCCVWNTDPAMWTACMLDGYGPTWKTKYPKCVAP